MLAVLSIMEARFGHHGASIAWRSCLVARFQKSALQLDILGGMSERYLKMIDVDYDMLERTDCLCKQSGLGWVPCA